MRAVKSQDTKPEKLIRKLVFGLGYRYRLYRRDLPGTPDLVFVRQRKVIFVHGCWWHGHTCKRGMRRTKTHQEYWVAKLAKNKARDAMNLEALNSSGWRCLVIWECELGNLELIEARILSFLGR